MTTSEKDQARQTRHSLSLTRTVEGDRDISVVVAAENKWQTSDSLPTMNSVVIKTNLNEIRFAEYGLQIPAIKILPCQAVSLS